MAPKFEDLMTDEYRSSKEIVAPYELGKQEGYGAAYSGDISTEPRESHWFDSLADWDAYLTGWYDAIDEIAQKRYAESLEGNAE